MKAQPVSSLTFSPDDPTANEVADAYRYCRLTTRQHAKSFYFCTQFLPRAKRRAIYAMYALCRHIDDAVDEAGARDEEEARRAVERWRDQLEAAYRGERSLSPVLLAWRDMLASYAIKAELPLELMRGVLMDTYIKRYGTWEELKVYCYRVASVVGLMSSEIFGYREPSTLKYAEALGLAMQLTNILRDVGDDAAMGRIYLPLKEINDFGYSETELLKGVVNEPFVSLMKFQIRRARSLYAEAERGISLLEADSRFTVLLAARLYGRILDEIEKNHYNVFTRRAHLTFPAKLRAVPMIWATARKI